MKIGVLTSSRADYGIYFPLLKALSEDNFFDLRILVFGTHLSSKYGFTIKDIEKDGFNIGCRLKTLPINDSPRSIAKSISKTINLFSGFWNNESFDLIIALGDRYEMFAAVTSTVPFNIPVAHIHGGETTLGAIDNIFRHSITTMSKIHFTACEEYKKRVVDIIGTNYSVFNVGALSIDSIKRLKLLTKQEFKARYNIDLEKPTVLFTFHPETVLFQKNKEFIDTIIEVFEDYKNLQFVITMPNADTAGGIIRNNLKKHIKNNSNAIGIESFGSLGYLSCMKHCTFMMGNSSSGFIEASYFAKPVINLGDRQKGRIETPNIITIPIEKKAIVDAIEKVKNIAPNNESEIYGEGNTANKIIQILKQFNKG